MNDSVTREYITVKGVNPTPKYPKFSNGGVLTDNGVWFNVAKRLDINQFEKDNVYAVDVTTNDKGYKTIVDVNTDAVVKTETPKPVEQTKNAYFEKKDESMKIGGLYHDSAQLAAAIVMSQGLALRDALETFDKVLEHILASRNS